MVKKKSQKKREKKKSPRKCSITNLFLFYIFFYCFFDFFRFTLVYYFITFIYSAVSGVDEHKRRQGKGQYVGFVTEPLTAGGTPIDPGVLPNFPGLNASQTNTAVFHTLFPNVFYFLLPSHMFVVRLGKVLNAR